MVLADLETAERRHEKYFKLAKSGQENIVQRDMAKRLVDILATGQLFAPLSGQTTSGSWSTSSDDHIKPTLYVCNVDEDSLDGNALVDKVRTHAESEGAGVVISAKVESKSPN